MFPGSPSTATARKKAQRARVQAGRRSRDYVYSLPTCNAATSPLSALRGTSTLHIFITRTPVAPGHLCRALRPWWSCIPPAMRHRHQPAPPSTVLPADTSRSRDFQCLFLHWPELVTPDALVLHLPQHPVTAGSHNTRCPPGGSEHRRCTVKISVVILTTIPWLIFITTLSSLPPDDTVVTHVIGIGN